MKPLPEVHISLWRSDAIVLFEWLTTVDLNAVPISHRAEKQALMDLLNCLNHQTDVPRMTQADLDVARAEVSEHMGW